MNKQSVVTGSNMNFESNEKYFVRKKFGVKQIIPLVFAAALIVAGLVIAFTQKGFFVLIGGVLALVGVIVLVISFTGKIKDDDVDDSVSVEIDAFKKRFEDTFLPTDSHREQVQTETLKKRCTFLYFDSYYFDRDGIIIKKGKDNKIRSTVFCMTAIYLFAEKVAFGKSLQSLLTDEAEDTYVDAKYKDLEKVEIEKVSGTAYQGSSDYVHVRVIRSDGKVIFETSAIDNAETDDYVSQINNQIKKAVKLRLEAEAREAQEKADAGDGE